MVDDTARASGPRRWSSGWLATAAAIVVWVAPLAPFAFQQFMVNQTAGKGFGAPSQVGTAASLSGNHLAVYSMLGQPPLGGVGLPLELGHGPARPPCGPSGCSSPWCCSDGANRSG